MANAPGDGTYNTLNNIYPPVDAVNEPNNIEERGNVQDSDKDEGTEREYQNTNSGFGSYHRDKSDGFTGYSSGSTTVTPSFLFSALIGAIAVVVL